MEHDRGPPNWLSLIVLLGLLALGMAGWKLFPWFAAFMGRQDCIATGHMNC